MKPIELLKDVDLDLMFKDTHRTQVTRYLPMKRYYEEYFTKDCIISFCKGIQIKKEIMFSLSHWTGHMHKGLYDIFIIKTKRKFMAFSFIKENEKRKNDCIKWCGYYNPLDEIPLHVAYELLENSESSNILNKEEYLKVGSKVLNKEEYSKVSKQVTNSKLWTPIKFLKEEGFELKSVYQLLSTNKYAIWFYKKYFKKNCIIAFIKNIKISEDIWYLPLKDSFGDILIFKGVRTFHAICIIKKTNEKKNYLKDRVKRGEINGFNLFKALKVLEGNKNSNILDKEEYSKFKIKATKLAILESLQ